MPMADTIAPRVAGRGNQLLNNMQVKIHSSVTAR